MKDIREAREEFDAGNDHGCAVIAILIIVSIISGILFL